MSRIIKGKSLTMSAKKQKQLRKNPGNSPALVTSSEVRVANKQFAKKIKKYAKELNKQLPKSEIWFNSLYKNYEDANDVYNKPLGCYIPDVANYRHKYVIEIDGSIHNLDEIKKHDRKKDSYYSYHGYKVFRVEAYSEESFNNMLRDLRILRKQVVLRKQKAD